jgi:cytochrome c oxidase cbb3-type subunit 3
VLVPFPRWFVRIAFGLACFACQSPPEDLREWRPTDHRNSGSSGATKKGQVSASATSNLPGVDQVALSTWQNNCVSCHGRVGKGDGPQAALYQPRDLSDPAFQATVSDEQLLQSIQEGKGKMPGFALPETTAQGLVKLVRLLGRRDTSAGATTSAPGVTSAPSSAVPVATVDPKASSIAPSRSSAPAPSAH